MAKVQQHPKSTKPPELSIPGHEQSRIRPKQRARTSPNSREYEKFMVHCESDRDFGRVMSMLTEQSHGRTRTTVISIISKGSIDDRTRSRLVNSLVPEVCDTDTCPPGAIGSHYQPHDHDNEAHANNIEHQIEGNIDLKNGLVVLSLSSLLGALNIDSVSRFEDTPASDGVKKGSTIIDNWPLRNQNLLKSLLLLFTVSHIVIFYNPEPSMDFSLIQTFKMLQLLMAKAKPRIVDLLKTINSSQTFRQWTRQARLACPRALFVCDTSYSNVNLDKNKMFTMKQELEDQIYLLLNKTYVISKSPIASLHLEPIFSLPARDDFVFFVSSGNLISSDSNDPMKMTPQSLSTPPTCANDGEITQESLTQEGPPRSIIEDRPDRNIQFWKFVNRHVTEIQTKHPSSMFLPRLDDLMTMLYRLKRLLFPLEDGFESSAYSPETSLPLGIDERRFVDIYELVNVDHLFSARHCLKAKSAAFDAYMRSVRLPDATHDMALEAAKKLYLNHARGPACEPNLGYLLEQCKNHWLEGDSTRPKVADLPVRGILRTRSSAVGFSIAGDSERSPVSPDASGPRSLTTCATKSSRLTISRRSNGVKVTTTCDCGRDLGLLVAPSDRKKKLDRVDVVRLNE